jgi:hypothetical protein
MTIEMRTSIELGDIASFEMECANCHARVIRQLADTFDVPPKCENCHAGWMMQGSQELNTLRQFLSQLQTYCKTAPNNNFVLRLEVTGWGEEQNRSSDRRQGNAK